MSAAKHSPGPWHYFMRPSRMWHVHSAGARAVCFTSARYTPEGVAKNHANARLIAAAPELLEAARVLVSGHGTLGDIQRAEAAIAKATSPAATASSAAGTDRDREEQSL